MTWNTNSSEIKLFIFTLVIIFGGIFLVVEKVTDYSFYEYTKRIQSKTLLVCIFIFHWLMSISIALLIPENFLNQVNGAKIDNPVFEYLVMLIFLLISLIVIGVFLNLIFPKRARFESKNSGSR